MPSWWVGEVREHCAGARAVHPPTGRDPEPSWQVGLLCEPPAVAVGRVVFRDQLSGPPDQPSEDGRVFCQQYAGLVLHVTLQGSHFVLNSSDGVFCPAIRLRLSYRTIDGDGFALP